jgi:capsule polysaccharide modification protein KpsS
MVKYKILEKDEQVPTMSKIEKSGIVTTITLDDTVRAFEENKKNIEKIEAELKVKKALRVNVENFHPEILAIDEKTQLTCHTYYEAGRFIKMAEEKLAEFAEAQADLEKEIKEIEKQTGITHLTEEKKSEIMKEIKQIIETKEE